MKYIFVKSPGVRSPRRNALRIALGYMAVAALWLIFSDRSAARFVTDQSISPTLQLVRGAIVILVTGGLLYWLLRWIYLGQSRLYRQIESSERAYRAMFEHNPNPMYIYDPQTLRFLSVNEAAIKKYGFTRDEFLTMTLWEIRPPQARAAMQRALDAQKHFRDVVVANAVTHWTKTRQLMTMEVTGYSLQFEGRDARLVLARDVSAHVQVENNLRVALRMQQEVVRIGEMGWWSSERDSTRIELSEQMQLWLEQPSGVATIDTKLFWQRIAVDDRDLLQRAFATAWQGKPLSLEIGFEGENGASRSLLIRGGVVDLGDTRKLICCAIDVTASKIEQERLRDNEKSYRQIAEQLPEALLMHYEARVIFANAAAAKMFGATRPEDMVGADIRDFIAVPSQPEAFDRLRSFQHGHADDTAFRERLLRRKSGEVFTAEVAAQTVITEGKNCILALVRDVDQQKKTQSELQVANERLQHLSEHMAQTSENERRQLSRELHDDLGQALTFIKMSAAWLRKRQQDVELAERVAQIQDTAGEALEKVRNLALTLRPAQLDTLGLKTAIEEHLRKFFGGTGIGYELDAEELQPRPQPLLEMAVFRIFQEALTNILRHSGASFVRVALTREGNALRLQIVDDGEGFDVDRTLAQARGLGLQTMRERAQQAGGTLHLHSVAGVGTELTAVFPETHA